MSPTKQSPTESSNWQRMACATRIGCAGGCWTIYASCRRTYKSRLSWWPHAAAWHVGGFRAGHGCGAPEHTRFGECLVPRSGHRGRSSMEERHLTKVKVEVRDSFRSMTPSAP